MKIIRRRRKTRKSFKYLKIYFEYEGDMYYREEREDFFLRRKTTKWFKRKISYRNEPKRFTTYEYERFVEIKSNTQMEKEYKKAYELYVFNLRNRKLNRLC